VPTGTGTLEEVLAETDEDEDEDDDEDDISN
jgi:hypothetical protein